MSKQKINEKIIASELITVSSDPILPPTGESTVITIAQHSRTITTRGKRQVDMTSLPRYSIIYDLPEEKKCCSCCNKPLHVIGEDKSEQLEIIPIQYCVIEHIRIKYGCRPCDSVVMAPKVPAPLPKAIAGPSLLTDVILNKYQYHLPLYRQSKIMRICSITQY